MKTVIMSSNRQVIAEQESELSSECESNGENEISDANNEFSDDDNGTASKDADDTVDNPGWADSIAKILKTTKPKGKKIITLSRAKKLTNIKKDETKDLDFELEVDGIVKKETIKVEEHEADNRKRAIKKKELPQFRIKPSISDKNRERTLSKIATRGVVQLFNAVRAQQKDIATKLEDAGPLERKREKVMDSINKQSFLNVLMGQRSEPEKKAVVESGTNQPKWSVLRDDFMMGGKLKDWDKEMEVDEEIEQISESE